MKFDHSENLATHIYGVLWQAGALSATCNTAHLPGTISRAILDFDPAAHRLPDAPAKPGSPQIINPPPGTHVAKVQALSAQVGGDHYDTPISHAEFCQRNGLTWCEASATKYLCRHRKKNKVQDLLKALHYTSMALDFEYPGWRDTSEAQNLLPAITGRPHV